MKRLAFATVSLLLVAFSCSELDVVKVDDPITISSPSPTEKIAKVTLNDAQSGYVSAGNSMSLRLLGELFDEENLICSPLSLQYVMAMIANGAEGETLEEILDFLGYGEDGIDVLNEYSRILIEQLPAVDLDVTLKVTDALLVNDRYPLLPAFKNTVEENYYAAVDNMDFSDPKQVAARINEWARSNTNGFIDKVLEPSEISPSTPASIMNALYFKAKWGGMLMFKEEDTKTESFRRHNGSTAKVDMMNSGGYLRYAVMDGYKVLELPYSNGKFNMYVLLPDENDIEGLIGKLKTTQWSDILGNMRSDAIVHVKMPKFDLENKFNFSKVLIDLGVEKAFSSSAEFDGIFESDDVPFAIEKIIQKARISVTEWGTEAGAVTVTNIFGGSTNPINEIDFHADHPFAFVIGEKTSGTILFTGVVMQP